ncbi:MAG: NAD(P)/FAD-dependent oxidoreductase [Acidimicrobiales bacterium]
MSDRLHDAIVVGGGPAGTAAAIGLADRGLDVVVIDKAAFPRDKTCGDGLTTLALRELERLGLTPDRVESWTEVERAHLHSPRGHTVTLPLPPGPGQFAAIARRVDLDAALIELATHRGVTVREQVGLRDASMHRHHVEVCTDATPPLHARWVIGADGIWSPLRRALGVSEPRYRGEWHAFRQYFSRTANDDAELHVWFEPDLLPGYAWSFPLGDGRANVGFGVLRGTRLDGKALARLWPDLLQRPAIRSVLGPRAVADGHHRAWPIPARITTTRLTAGRALFVGDAARVTDLFTGEGIGQALLSGRLAAEALAGGIDATDPAPVTNAYSTSVLHELAPDHRMAATLSRLMAVEPLAEASIRLVGSTRWTRRNVGRWLFEDSPRGIALTPRRWRRGVLSGPPAFTTTTQR